jgi:broad specificity polyphosphatase/5'/3'-nucleotidase SurE
MEERSQRILLISKAIAFALFLETWLDEYEYWADLDDNDIRRLYEKWLEDFVYSVNQPHSGDCRNQPWSCTRCSYEQIEKDALRIAYVIEEHDEYTSQDTFPEFLRVLTKRSKLIDPKGFLGDD